LAEKEDLDELKDIANILKSALEGALASSERINRSFSSTKNDLIDLDDLFQKLVETSEGLPENIATGKDLQKALINDAKLFNKVQLDSIKLFDRINEQGWEEMLRYLEHTTGKQGEALEQTAEYAAALEDRNNFEEKNLTLIQKQFAVMQKQANARKLDSLSLGNITESIKDLGAKIRNPDAAFSSMLKSGGQLPSKIFEAAKGSKNLGETMSKLVGPSMEKMQGFAKILFSPAGLLIVGVAAAVAALVGLYALFKNFWEFMDKNVVPAQAEFNKQIGGSGPAVGQLQSQMHGVGEEFLLLGKSYEEGAKLVRDFSSGLKSVQLDPKTLKTGKELVGILQLSGEEAGSLALQFQKQTGSLDGLNEMMNVGAREAKTYGLPVNDVLRDLGKFPNILARFGTANRTEFAKSAAKARSYGLDIGKVDAAFGDQLDTFEGSSDVAAKMNAMFGTTINSFELMLETDPIKRMEMLRKQLVSQGKEWNNLSKFEQNVITSSMGVDKEMASMMLSSDKERKALEKKQRQKDREIKMNERWNKGISSIKSTLIAWGAQIDKVMRGVSKLIATMFGLDEPGKLVTGLADTLVSWFTVLNKWLIDTKKSWADGGKGMGTFGKIFKLTFDILKIGFKVVWFLVKKFFDIVWKLVTLPIKLIKAFSDILGISDFFADILDTATTAFSDMAKIFDDLDLDAVWEGMGLAAEETFEEIFAFLKLWLWDKPSAFFKSIDWSLVWKGMQISLKETWDSVMSFLKDGVKKLADLLKGPFEGIASMFESAGSILGLTKKSVGDALITKAGKVIEFSPNDNILATQTPLDAMIPKPSAQASYGKTGTSELKVIADALQQIMNMKQGNNKATQPEIKIEIMDINLDGKKIGEAQVKISRY